MRNTKCGTGKCNTTHPIEAYKASMTVSTTVLRLEKNGTDRPTDRR